VTLVLTLVLLVSVVVLACEPLPPGAQFGALPETGQAPLEVHFIDLSMGEIDSWQWDFDNDGRVDSTLANPWYTYRDAGSYTVSLTVSGIGGSDTEVKPDYLEVTVPCQADFVAEPTAGKGVTEVQFSDQSAGQITSWAWDFNGDSVVDSTEQSPVYVYRRDGLYSVTLTIAGPGCGDTLTRIDYIQIAGCPT